MVPALSLAALGAVADRGKTPSLPIPPDVTGRGRII
jgi:hypothetical protein